MLAAVSHGSLVLSCPAQDQDWLTDWLSEVLARSLPHQFRPVLWSTVRVGRTEQAHQSIILNSPQTLTKCENLQVQLPPLKMDVLILERQSVGMVVCYKIESMPETW